MKASLYTALLSLSLSFAVTHTAHASPFEDRFEQHLARQADRIDHGAEEGSLTQHEQQQLDQQQQALMNLCQRFTRDGRLSRKERRILNHQLSHASDMIYEYRHNDSVAYIEHEIETVEDDFTPASVQPEQCESHSNTPQYPLNRGTYSVTYDPNYDRIQGTAITW